MSDVLAEPLVGHSFQFGAWTDQTHAPADHVEELGQLIEAVLAEDSADRRVPRVGRRLVGLAPIWAAVLPRLTSPAVVHRSKFQTVIGPPASSDALLAQDDATAQAAGQHHPDGDHHGTQEHHQQQRDTEIEQSLADTAIHGSSRSCVDHVDCEIA